MDINDRPFLTTLQLAEAIIIYLLKREGNFSFSIDLKEIENIRSQNSIELNSTANKDYEIESYTLIIKPK